MSEPGADSVRAARSDAEAKEIARFYERPIGKRLRSVDAEAHRKCLTAVLTRVEQMEGTLAARLGSVHAELDAIADEFVASQR